MSRLKQQMRERRERILGAARSIIAEAGYPGLSMRALAQASRVTVPTIYNLIGTKEDVVVEAVAEQMRGFVLGLEAKGDLLALVQAAIDDFIALPVYYRGLLPALSNKLSLHGRDARHPMREQIEAALRAAKSAGDLKEKVDPVLLSERIQTHLEATSLQWSEGHLDDTAFRAAALFEVALVGMAAFQGPAVDRFQEIFDRHQSEARLRDRSGEETSRAKA